eukprot:CAMPEP_0172177434 /NCGR_PEP_ID=MMETSP1050-20130122/15434_1 /TAXON_ID=233186 /ORGANISM="Cryptomonas curvata, Strain CCAP979/52" /LENGTH=143 /DNA_ID=CAMNT_0012849953 /DNA_START=82 /DNA_END=514 /DNA_ORIENTATION=-
MVTVLVLISIQSVFGQAWSIQLDMPKSFASQVTLKGDDFYSEQSDLDDGTDYENSDQDDVMPSDVSTRPNLLTNGAKYITLGRKDISSSNSDWNSDVDDETALQEMILSDDRLVSAILYEAQNVVFNACAFGIIQALYAALPA